MIKLLKMRLLQKVDFSTIFEGKRDLAKHLMIRFLKEDKEIFENLVNRADSLTEDPLQRILILLNLYVELVAELPKGHPGCLVASYIYEQQQFDPEIYELAQKGMQDWKESFEVLLQHAAEKYPPTLEIDLGEVSDMLTTVFEGGIILSKISGKPKALCKQLLLYRTYIRFIFGDI